MRFEYKWQMNILWLKNEINLFWIKNYIGLLNITFIMKNNMLDFTLRYFNILS